MKTILYIILHPRIAKTGNTIQSGNHSVNNGPVKRLTLVARLPPAFYAFYPFRPHAGWNYGIANT